MVPAGLLGTASLLPGRSWSTADVLAATGLPASVEEIEGRTGIRNRHWSDGSDEAADLAAEVVRRALADAGLEKGALRRLVFACSTGGDFVVPATANAVLETLGISHTCDGFDLNNACMGFLTGFDLAARCVATGLGPVAIVAVELMSRFIAPHDPRPYLVFGDAAAGAIVGAPGPDEGILAAGFGNDGGYLDGVAMAHPGRTLERETVVFAASNRRITAVALDAVERCAREVVERAGLTLAEIDWLVPHQPNGRMVDELLKRLNLPSDRFVRVVDEIGSVAGASIPYGLDALRRQRSVAPGDRILMAGVGAGMAYGAVVFQVAR